MKKKMFNVPAAYYMLVVPPGHRKYQVAIVLTEAAVMVDQYEAEMKLGIRVGRDPLEEILTTSSFAHLKGTYDWFIDPRNEGRLLTPWRFMGPGSTLTQPVKLEHVESIWNKLSSEDGVNEILGNRPYAINAHDVVKMLSSAANPLANKCSLNFESLGGDKIVLHENNLSQMRKFRAPDTEFCQANQIYIAKEIFEETREAALAKVTNIAKDLILYKDQIFVPSSPPVLALENRIRTRDGSSVNNLRIDLGTFDGRTLRSRFVEYAEKLSINDSEMARRIINDSNILLGNPPAKFVFNEKYFVSPAAMKMIETKKDDFLFQDNHNEGITFEFAFSGGLTMMRSVSNALTRNENVVSALEPTLSSYRPRTFDREFRDEHFQAVRTALDVAIAQAAELLRRKRSGQVWELAAQATLEAITNLQTVARQGLRTMEENTAAHTQEEFSSELANSFIEKGLESMKIPLKLALGMDLIPQPQAELSKQNSVSPQPGI